MPTYAIGDLQGCFVTLQSLLGKIEFDAAEDRLWFVGDLVNRGAGSLECLRFISALGDRAVTVLGNHDLHLLALAERLGKAGKNDTLAPILAAPDRDELLQWLRTRKLLHADGSHVMVHAGLLPQWDLATASRLAKEIEDALRGPHYRDLLAHMYGNQPDHWHEELAGAARARIVINAFTRIRVVTEDGRMDLGFKGELAKLPPNSRPWFEALHPDFATRTVIAGHWSALGLRIAPTFAGIDTGCIWGRELTAFRLDDRQVFQVPSAEASSPEGWD